VGAYYHLKTDLQTNIVRTDQIVQPQSDVLLPPSSSGTVVESSLAGDLAEDLTTVVTAAVHPLDVTVKATDPGASE